VFQEWHIQPDLIEESSQVSLYDLVMEIQQDRLIISLPLVHEKELSPTNNTGYTENGGENARKEDMAVHTDAASPTSSLWEKIQVLARLSSSLKNSTLKNSTLMDTSLAEGGESYLKSRQEALERFLKFSLGRTDEESYWLKKM
jgi:hypothetical protein